MNDSQETKGISRQDEEAFLSQTLDVIRRNLENYGEQVSSMRAEIDEMLEHFHDDNPEVINLLENRITLHDHMARALERNEKALKKPYFGRIDFHDEALDRDETLYIGKGGISIDTTHQAVVDWRAPIANVYYENGLGECSYTAPGRMEPNPPMEEDPSTGENHSNEIKIDLKRKRTYEIEDGKLLDYFDSEVVANDDLLTKYLSKNKQAVLGEIVATIQKEQNDIIRKSPYHNIIVQGVAGSGKTTVAMHRISFILYNYQDRFKPDDFYIVGSNRILLNYITGVLPDLDVNGVRQMTMEQLFVRLLYEDWDEKKYRIKASGQSGNRDSIKGTSQWFRDLKDFCDEEEWKGIYRESIYLNPRQFVEGLRDGKSGVYDETGGKKADPRTLVLLVDGEAVERYIRQNPKVSMQSKINMLNDRLISKIKEEFLGKGVKYTEVERKAILKAYRGRYGKPEWKGSIYTLYQEFLTRQATEGKAVDVPNTEFDVYDLAALAYIYKRIKETEVISEAHHIVIDEAQDFGMMAYLVLHFCIHACTYTIMGDVSQNIHFGFGLNDWEELKELLLPDSMDSFGILKKSYRNTIEISEFATNILHHGRFSSYPVEPIIRHGNPVRVLKSDRKNLFQTAAHVCKEWQKSGYDTIAVVCRNNDSADRAAKQLGKYVEVMENDLEKAEFGNGIMVLPVEYTKGLEFDTVLILEPDREDYPLDDGHAKLLYVAATRALHELCVLDTGDLTGLIADPIPEGQLEAKVEKLQDEQARQERIGRFGARETKEKKTQGTDKKQKAETTKRTGAETSQEDQIQRNQIQGNQIQGKKLTTEREHTSPLTQLYSKPRARVIINQQTNMENQTKNMTGTDAQSKPRNSADATTQYQANPPTNLRQQQNDSLRKTADNVGSATPVFGDIPPTEQLRSFGHSRIDTSVRWIAKRPDGLYLQSRYGVLRLSPVGSAIIRVTFVRDGQPSPMPPSGIAVDRVEKFWMYKDSGSIVELSTDELILQVVKSTGAVRYMTRDKRLLLAERDRECRQLEHMSDGKWKTWLSLDWAKGEQLYGIAYGAAATCPAVNAVLPLRGTARYLSGGLSLLFSDRGYGILLAADTAFSCDIPTYGSYLCTESAQSGQQDFYFMAGKTSETIQKACAYLCGEL